MATGKRNSEKQKRYRDRLSKQGLRPVQILVPDISSPNFVKECRRQSLIVARDPHEKEIMEFLEAVGDWGKHS